MIKLVGIVAFTCFFISCGSSTEKAETEKDSVEYDSKKGSGKFDKVELADKLDVNLAEKGEKLYALKCASCHKLSKEILVGPGWLDVTKRRTPEWLMNFMTNTDEMLEKDETLKAQLESCKIRMPNQDLTDQESREIFEFMRSNDGVK